MVLFLAMVREMQICLVLYVSLVSMQYLLWKSYSMMICLKMVIWESRKKSCEFWQAICVIFIDIWNALPLKMCYAV